MSNLHKRQVYAGLMEIIKDDKYYYNSRVNSDYNKLTEAGEKAVLEYIKDIAPQMLRKNNEELERVAKQMVWDGLQK